MSCHDFGKYMKGSFAKTDNSSFNLITQEIKFFHCALQLISKKYFFTRKEHINYYIIA